MDFPLYTTLSGKIPKRDLTKQQKEELIKKIKDLDDISKEHFTALITKYASEHCEENFYIPYGGKAIKNDILFDLAKFPHGLRQILYKFMQAHSKKLEEDELLSRQSLI